MIIHHKFTRNICIIIYVITLCLTSVYPVYSVESQYSESYSSGIFYRRLQNIHFTGDMRNDIVMVAMSQIGYTEGNTKTQLSGFAHGSGNYTEYGLWYNNLQSAPGGYEKAMWCAMFVSWCANQAGIPSNTVYYHAYTVYGVNWFIDQELAYTRQQVVDGIYTPQPGDLVYFKSSRNGDKVNHVGIVVKYENNILYAVEGNTNDSAHSTNGGQVCLKSYQITDTFIRYICSPSYT